MTAITETDVVAACQTLFGHHVDISRDFLFYVQPSGVKSAYRKKAKENHPDLFAADPLHVQQKQTVLFREILDAYDVLTLFFKQRDQGAWRSGVKASHQTSPKKDTRQAKQPSDPSTTQNRNNNDTYYRGAVPYRTLQIGQYLYYRGRIPFGALINALVWQRKQRPSIGDIALQWGLLNAEGVNRIFSVCGRPRLFGEKAVALGLLTIFQVNTILLYQRAHQDRLGNYFVQNNILSRQELEHLAQSLKEHNARILATAKQRQ